MKVVFDSSVWIAAIGSQTGFASVSINRSFTAENVEIFISAQILDEITNLQKKLDFQPQLAFNARRVVRDICDFEIGLSGKDLKGIKIADKNDAYVLALCYKVQADYLVTFDRKHLLPLKKYRQTEILEPKNFSKIFEDSSSQEN